jgi:DNA processing protein
MHSSSPEAVSAGGVGNELRRLMPDDAEFPARLRELPRAPTQLWVRGTLAVADPPAVAIVGSRNATPYGRRVAMAIAERCAGAGVCVVSGLARGIDGAAHEAALAAGGRTVAVLGTGIDQYYPRSHRALQERIARDGLVLSELGPGDPGHRGSFPVRNRLIAALADVTVVVEAGEESGSLITADVAIELGRTVACVPNAIDLPNARGSNALLKRHAEPVLSPDDVLALLSITAPAVPRVTLDGEAAQCWDALQRGASDVAEVARLAGMSTRQASAVLALLEIDGLVSFNAAGRAHPTVLTP